MPGVGLTEGKGLAWETIPSGELGEAPQGQLREFRQDLLVTQENGAVVLQPESFAEGIRQEKPINAQIVDRIHSRVTSAGRHFYLSPEFAWLGESEVSSFSVVRTAGAETSAHGVFFGLLSDEAGKLAFPVAIKPFRKKPGNAYNDWLNNSLIADTDQDHFEPVGFVIGERVNYSITELKQGADTLDNSAWGAVLLDEHNPEYEGQRALLEKVGVVLGELHARRIFHGDLQFKNIVNDVAGNIFFIDWESSSFYGDEASRDVLVSKAAHDLRVLFGSMARSESDKGVELLSKFDPWMQWQHFKRYIFDPYMEQYLEAGGADEAFDQVAEVEGEVRDYILHRGLRSSLSRIRHS